MLDKPIAQKLQIKANSTISFVKEPEGYLQAIGDLPDGCTILPPGSTEKADFIQVFVANKAELIECLPKLISRLAPKGALWISYYKGTSKIPTDINRDSIWEICKQNGLAAVRQIAIDQDWSALRFKVVDIES
jgi:hypothetical protein